jgi:hypothetical protein
MKFILTITFDDAFLDRQLAKEGQTREDFKELMHKEFSESILGSDEVGATLTVEVVE